MINETPSASEHSRPKHEKMWITQLSEVYDHAGRNSFPWLAVQLTSHCGHLVELKMAISTSRFNDSFKVGLINKTRVTTKLFTRIVRLTPSIIEHGNHVVKILKNTEITCYCFRNSRNIFKWISFHLKTRDDKRSAKPQKYLQR